MNEDRWDQRLRTTVIAVVWISLGVAIVASIIESPDDPLVFVSAGLGAIWVLGTTSIPLAIAQRPYVLDGITLLGVVLTMTALVLTGGSDSPYLLLAVTPSIYAGLFGGIRIGLSVGALTALLSTAIPLAAETSVVDSLPLSILALALGVAVAQIRRVLIDLDTRASAAEATSDASTVRLRELESANQLLARLAEITSRDEMNPISVGRAALEAITQRFPGSAGTAALEGENGPILVSKYGTVPNPAYDTDIPLIVGDSRVGFIRLSTPTPLDHETVESLPEALGPLSLAFANALLLQDVTKNAVREERVRLARELHDEIGPSLASLGLSLDMALIQGVDQREINDHLNVLRERVGSLVDEVRSTVTDLRSGGTTSLISRLKQLQAVIPDEPTLVIDVDERRPVRPSISENVHGIVGEAVRNAVEHSKGTSVVVKGWIDFDRGRIVVVDDGTGFDTGLRPPGHFGLVGMHERANASSIRLNVDSSDRGTSIEIEWGEP